MASVRMTVWEGDELSVVNDDGLWLIGPIANVGSNVGVTLGPAANSNPRSPYPACIFVVSKFASGA